MKRISIILTVAVVILFASCKKNLPDIGGTATEKLSNEWWVTLNEGGVNLFGGDNHVKIETSNTANNTNEIWVSDFWALNPIRGNVWAFQVKAQADLTNLTFAANQAESIVPGYNIKVNITNGKIIPGGGHSRSGNVTDSIYMKISFEDDPVPGTIYELKGHSRTKFIEDEY